MALERQYRRRIEQIYGKHMDRILRHALARREPQLMAVMEQLGLEVGSASYRAFIDAIVAEAAEQAEKIGIDPDPDELMTEAGTWARGHAAELVKRVGDTERKHIRQTVTQLANHEITREDAEAVLRRTFGPVRARMIATTELTKAYHEGTIAYKRQLDALGMQTQVRWLTAQDERVCPICGPLDNKLDDEWRSQFSSGPPCHVNCRCRTVVEKKVERAERIPGAWD